MPNYARNDATLKVEYQNPQIFLNFLVLFTATHSTYQDALVTLSRVIKFFQFRNCFTQDNVAWDSIQQGGPVSDIDRLEVFKLIFDIYSPTLEEVNHLWGTLGGKQYPFVLYVMRMLDLQYKASLVFSLAKNRSVPTPHSPQTVRHACTCW